MLDAPLQGRREQVIAPYTDLRLHDLGRVLDDMTVTGQPVQSRWRTAPLWGLRMRPRYMHDLKSLTLQSAIERHEGEAEHVVRRFRDLTEAQKKDVLTFLESL